MKRIEKIFIIFLFLVIVLCGAFVINQKIIQAFPGAENLTTVAPNDTRVNPEQAVLWTIPVLNNITFWVNITVTFNTTTYGPYNITINPSGNAVITQASPTNPGIYVVDFNTTGAIQNATYPNFIVDSYNISVYALYTEVQAGFNTLIYAEGTSVVDGHNLTDGDTLTINGLIMDWNTYLERFEAIDTSATPTIRTYNTLTALLETSYGITNGSIIVYPTVTFVTPPLNLIIPFIRIGDWPGAVIEINTLLMGETLFWTFLLTAISLGIYNYAGAEVTIAAWILGWGTFSTVIQGEAYTIALIMIALAGGIYIAKFFLDRRTSV